MNSSIQIAAIIISIALIGVILIQAKGSGGLGGISVERRVLAGIEPGEVSSKPYLD